MIRLRGSFAIMLAALFCLYALPVLPENNVSVTANPARIEMGTQFNGADITVSGAVPVGSEVVVRFTGAPGELHLREKGKVFGLLWMNVGSIVMKNVPKVCIVDTSRPFSELGTAAIQYGLGGVIESMTVEEDGKPQSIDVEDELLQLKRKEGLFNQTENGIQLGADNGSSRSFSATLTVPPSLTPGTYHIEAVAFRDGAVIGEAQTAISAELTGFPKWLSALAFQKSLIYGIMATVIAIASGFLIGLVFQGKGAH